MVSCRKNGEFINAEVNAIDLMDVSPQQLVSVSSSLIPFIENDDIVLIDTISFNYIKKI